MWAINQQARVFKYGFVVGLGDFVHNWSWRTWLFGWIFRVFCSAATWVLLGKALGSQEILYFLIVGNAVYMGASAPGTVAACTWDRFEGTYPFLVISPASLVPSMLGRTSVWLLNGLATALAAFGLLAVAFRLPLPMPHAIFLPLAVGIVCLTTYGFTLFLGALVIRKPSLRNIVHNIASPIMMAICGVSVPLNFWPVWIERLASILPLSHGLLAIRALLSGGNESSILWNLMLELVVGLAWLLLGVIVMKRLAEYGRADGSIEFSW